MDAAEFKIAMDAVDLTADDAREQLLALNTGLMNSNATLLAETKTKIAAANEATEAQRELAVKAEEDRLKLAGDMDGLKKHYEEQLTSKIAEANRSAETARGALNARDKGEVINSILSNVDDRYKNFAKTQLESSVSISYDEAGSTVINIKDGDKQYASSADFLDGVNESETWKHVLTATSLSGANTQQSNGSGNAPQNSIQSNLASRLKANGLI